MTDIDANLNDGGSTETNNSQTPAWTAQLPGDLQKNESLTSFQNIGEMGTAYLNTRGELDGLSEKMKSALFVPGEDATDEERAAFYTALGRPESPDKYTLQKPEGLPDGVNYSEESEAVFKNLAHETGMSEAQAQKLHQWYWDSVKNGAEIEKQQAEEALNSLKDEWKGDLFKQNSELAVRAFKKFGGEEATALLESAKIGGIPIGDHPVIVKMFHEIGKSMSNDTLSDGDRTSQLGQKSDEELAKQRFPNTKWS